MQRISKSTRAIWVLILLCFYIMVCIFQNNFLSFVEENDYFRKFENVSKSLVVGKIVADERGLDTGSANLGFVSEGDFDRSLITTESFRIFRDDSVPTEKLKFRSYSSQHGLQGRAYSALRRHLGLKLKHFEIINSILLTFVLYALYFCYSKIFDRKYALIFLIVSISSPWVVIFARNYYWVPFTWYLPTLFAALAYLAKRKTIFYLLIFFSFFIKSLSGYEYISSITLMACSIPLIAPFFQNSRVNWQRQLKEATVIFLLCVGGFLAAFLLHAKSFDSSNFFAGVQHVIGTAAKRTVGNEVLLSNPQGQAAINASPLSVVNKYIIHWGTPIFLGIPGKWFLPLFYSSVASLFLKLILRPPNWKKHWVLFGVSLLIPVSWFVLGKTHSFFHLHLNYVLWYLGFIPAMIYILSDDVATLFRYLHKGFSRLTRKFFYS